MNKLEESIKDHREDTKEIIRDAIEGNFSER